MGSSSFGGARGIHGGVQTVSRTLASGQFRARLTHFRLKYPHFDGFCGHCLHRHDIMGVTARMITTPWDADLAQELQRQFGTGIVECSCYLGQNFAVARPERAVEVLAWLKREIGRASCRERV